MDWHRSDSHNSHGTGWEQKVNHFLWLVERELATVNQSINRAKSSMLLVTDKAIPAHFRKSPGGVAAPLLAQVPLCTQLKVLGVWFDTKCAPGGNVNKRMTAGEKCVRGVCVKATMLGISRDTPILMQLMKTQLPPTLLFGDVIWGGYLHGSKDLFQSLPKLFEHPLHKPWNSLLKYALNVTPSTSTWIALMLGVVLPIRHFILKDFANFWNQVVVHDNPLVRASMQAQQALHAAGHSYCWLSQWVRTARHISADLAVAVANMQPIEVPALHDNMLDSYDDMLTSYGNPYLDDCQHRYTAMHFCRLNVASDWGKAPAHVNWDLPWSVRRLWMQFMTCTAPIPVRRDAWVCEEQTKPYLSRVCSHCTATRGPPHTPLADESHVLLHCPVTSHMRTTYCHTVSLQHQDVRDLLMANVDNPQVAVFVADAIAHYASVVSV